MTYDDKIILGINLSHDMSCAAVVGGEVKVAIAEERLTRVKYCTGLTPFGKIIPYRAIRYCCDFLGIAPSDVDLFVVNSCRANALAQLRAQLIGIPEDRVIALPHPGHHLAHAFSAMYCSGFEEAAVIVMDTNGSFIEQPGKHGGFRLEKKEHFACYRGDDDGLRVVLRDDVLPGEVSLGELYCIYSAALQLTPRPGPYGFDDPLSAGGKLMGLASHDLGRTPAPSLWEWRDSRMPIRLARLVDHLARRGFVDRNEAAKLDTIFGFEMNPFVGFKRRGKRSLKNQEYLSLAGEAQRLLEKALLEIAGQVHEETGSSNLCAAGGSMLNVTACTLLLENTPFERLFVQPAAGDSGNAIGAALYGYREHLGGRRRPYLEQTYDTCLGKSYATSEIQETINRYRGMGCFSAHPVSTLEDKARAVIPRLLDDEIVGLFEGRSEFGPRALGHRSFVASPKNASMRKRMNRLKKREWYRPVAPAILEEALGQFFDAPFEKAPYMNFSARCKDVTRERAPAIVHVDGTARPQTVSASQSPLLHVLLGQMAGHTGVPILVNTSFNTDGEPIVETPAEAIETFLRTDLFDALLLGDHFIKRCP